MPPVPPPPPNPAHSPLGHYLLHPGQVTSEILHHLLHVAETLGKVVAPIALAVVLVFVVARVSIALSRHRRSTTGAQLVAIAPGPDVDPTGAEALWVALHGILRRDGLASLSGRPHVSCELAWSDGRLQVQIWVPPEVQAARVAEAAEAAWPSSRAKILPAPAPIPEHATLAAGELRLAEREWFSLRHDHRADPYRMLLGAIRGHCSGDAALVQVLARPASARRYRRCRNAAKALRTGQPVSRLARFVRFWTTTGVPPAPNLSADPTRSSDVRLIGEKASSLGFEAVIRYAVAGNGQRRCERRRLRSDARGIVGSFAHYDGRNHLVHRHLVRAERKVNERHLGRGDLLSVGELAALAHLPTDSPVVGLSHAAAHSVAPPPEVGATGKPLGHADTGERRRVALAVADARQHVHVLGATGSGKSTLITNLVLADVAARRGAVVVDPKGDLVDDILDRLPQDALGRVVILDPDDAEAPPSMNVLGAF